MKRFESAKNLFGGMKSKAVLPVFFLLSGIVLVACNDDQPLPPGSTVVVSPEKKTWLIRPVKDDNGNCIHFKDFYNDHPVLITVFDAQGSPIGEADLTVSLDLAGNTFSVPGGGPVVRLYDDKNGNGVVDDPEELVSDSNDPLYRTKTAKYTGEKLLILRMDLSCRYQATLFAVSDGYMGTGVYEVEEENEDEQG